MIKYRLNCKKCNNNFDSWFATSKEYEKLKKLNHLICHYCSSVKVEKTLMSPSVLNSNKENLSISKNNKYYKIKNKIKKYQKFIKKNFNYVGDNFTHEARTLHYNSKKKDKGIYGIASTDEIKDLREEGIDTETIPWIEDKNN